MCVWKRAEGQKRASLIVKWMRLGKTKSWRKWGEMNGWNTPYMYEFVNILVKFLEHLFG